MRQCFLLKYGGMQRYCIGVDDTIERRKGKKIKDKGCYRDPVRSTKKHVVRCFGLKWLSMMLIGISTLSLREMLEGTLNLEQETLTSQ